MSATQSTFPVLDFLKKPKSLTQEVPGLVERADLVSFQISPYGTSWEGRRMNVHVIRAGMVPDVVDQRRSHLLGATAGPACPILVPEIVRVAQ